MGFWTFGGNKDWGSGKGSDMDNALVVFIQMKEKYGDQFQLIIEDLKEKGATRADGTETSKIHIKVVVEPRSIEIESQIESLGLIYVEQ